MLPAPSHSPTSADSHSQAMSALVNKIIPLKPGRFSTKWLLSDWKFLSKKRNTTPQPTSIRLVSWNVDFMAPNADARLRCALDHIRSALEGQAGGADAGESPVPCCILLQEIEGEAMSVLLKHRWVREHFIAIPTSANTWPSPRYGNVTLVSNTVPTVGAQSLVFGNSVMGRNAVFVDVQLAAPGDGTPALLRIANVHLESLPEGTSRRPAQLLATAELLRAPGVHAGIVAGDMNPIDPRDATLPAEAELTDAYQGSEDDETSFTWGYQPRNRFPVCRMDKILHTGSSSLVVDPPSRIGVGLKTAKGQWASDHYGLMTTVRLCAD
ncbi:Endonuclease/exonuclease/phosphatase [Fomitopsis serialis]|uniref:Endonuclease/exonuclease/phosphatase n=1 Tax=Fomitopsis serialis TaxID=139415 RepID=UPI0020086627|nr:Endonuclease/exonuclease/phosphatase [Neoantrodia serialis]KAH9938708.1 Endonuclease/exonuclease/phosphatase [Neoantrodia serialis]